MAPCIKNQDPFGTQNLRRGRDVAAKINDPETFQKKMPIRQMNINIL